MGEGKAVTEMEANNKISCDWTVSGMDCGSCATKIKDALARLPGVTGVEVGIMSERLRLTLDEGETGRDKIEKTVRALGYGISPRMVTADPVEDNDHGGSGTGHSHADGNSKDDFGHGSSVVLVGSI